jgi:hypothetical protein
MPSSLDVTGLDSFEDERLLCPTDKQVAHVAWRMAGEYQGQTWGPSGVGPSLLDPWDDIDVVGSRADETDDDERDRVTSSRIQKRAKVHSPPGCCITSFGGGEMDNQDNTKSGNSTSIGGMLLCTICSRLGLCAPSDGAAAELLGSWLSTQLFDTAPEGHRLHGPTCLVICTDIPLVASSQMKPSPKVDAKGRRYVCVMCLSQTFLILNSSFFTAPP